MRTLLQVVKDQSIDVALVLEFMDTSKQFINSKFELSQFDQLYNLLQDVNKVIPPTKSQYAGLDRVEHMIYETDRFLRIIQFELFGYCNTINAEHKDSS